MNKGNTLVAVIFACTALLIIFLAYLIKYKKQYNIIAGYDESTVKDKDGLANWVGGTLLITGSIALVVSVSVIILPGCANIAMGIYGAAIVIGAMIAAIGGNKYKA